MIVVISDDDDKEQNVLRSFTRQAISSVRQCTAEAIVDTRMDHVSGRRWVYSSNQIESNNSRKYTIFLFIGRKKERMEDVLSYSAFIYEQKTRADEIGVLMIRNYGPIVAMSTRAIDKSLITWSKGGRLNRSFSSFFFRSIQYLRSGIWTMDVCECVYVYGQYIDQVLDVMIRDQSRLSSAQQNNQHMSMLNAKVTTSTIANWPPWRSMLSVDSDGSHLR